MARFVLVPGFWLGAWAWDEVATSLREAGHDVEALTLPGLESVHADRSSIRLDDHVDAVVRALQERPDQPAILVGHSGAGAVVYAATDREPALVANGTSIEGLSDEQLAEFRSRALPHPAGPARDPLRLVDPRRCEVPVTMISSSFPAEQIHKLAADGHPYFAELSHLDVTIVDLPTGHWPMWSRPQDLATELRRAADSSPTTTS